MIVLDAATMHDMHIEMYMSDAHVCLVPEAIPIEHIQRITLLQNSKLTVYRRPTAAERATIQWMTIITCRLCLQQLVEFGHMAMPKVLGAHEPRSHQRRAVFSYQIGRRADVSCGVVAV